MHERRSKFDIAYEILLEAQNPTSKTRLVYSTNLNFRIAEKYFTLLEDLALLEKICIDGKSYYLTTEKGREFIKRYEDLAEDFSKNMIIKHL